MSVPRIQAFDFDAVKVDILLIECSGYEDKLSYLMHTRGYSKHPRIHGDLVFVRRRAKGLCSTDPVAASLSD